MNPEKIKYREKSAGWIEVITGSMFSGKTEELIRRLKRARFARQKIRIFKPAIDDRYDLEKVISHDENAMLSTRIDSSDKILLLSEDAEVVGIDEAQFFDNNLPGICNKLANKGVRVIAAGLDMDFQGKPFDPMPELLAIAEDVTKLHAICLNCGNLAAYSFRKTGSKEKVVVGEMEKYMPLCRKCYNIEQQKKNA